MNKLSYPIILCCTLAAAGATGCKKKSNEAVAVAPALSARDAVPALAPTDAPRAEATPRPTPTPVQDAVDEYKLISQQILADLSKKDFASFVKNSMVTREQLQAMMQDGWTVCPAMAPIEEHKPEAEQMLVDYDPEGEAIKGGFDGCLAKYDFSKASYLSATSREHLLACGSEAADHVEVQVTIDKIQVVLVLDDLLKTVEGWRLVDSGISCAE